MRGNRSAIASGDIYYDGDTYEDGAVGDAVPVTRGNVNASASRRGRTRHEPEATVARIKAVIMKYDPLEPWRPAGEDRIAGSGWFVRLPWEHDDGPDQPPRFLVTCNHCVEGVKARDGMAVQTSSTGDGMWRARVAAVVPEIDAAIVEVLPTPGMDPRALVAWPLGDDRIDVAMGDDVQVYGYPLGQENLKSANSTVNGREGGLLQLDGSINLGDSGGPVVRGGRVVGWITQGIPDANAVSFAQPISFLLAALFALRPLPATSDADWAPYGGLPPPARVLRRGGLGCALYASNNDRLAVIGARCPNDGRGGAAPALEPRSRLPTPPDPWGGGGPRYTGFDFGPSGATARVGAAPPRTAPPTRSGGCDCPSGAVIQWISRRSDLVRPPFEAKPGDILCGLVLPMVPPGHYRPLVEAATDGIGNANTPSPDTILQDLGQRTVPVTLNVGNGGSVVLPWTDDRVDVERALMLVPWGMRIGVRVYRADQRRAIAGPVGLTEATEVDGFYRPYRPFEPDDYEAFGGIVVGPLTADSIDAFRWLGARLSPTEREEPRLVILRALMGGPLNAGPADDEGVNIREGSLIARVNGRPVRTMDDYREALMAPLDGAYLMIETDRGRGDIASMATVLAAEADLAAQYGYPLSGTWERFLAAYAP
nr:trypsin-like serine protease [Pandoravirus massiliensis]